MGKIIQNGIEYGKTYNAGTLLDIDSNNTINVKMVWATVDTIAQNSSRNPTTLFYTTQNAINMSFTGRSVTLKPSNWESYQSRYSQRVTCAGIMSDSHVVYTVNYLSAELAHNLNLFILNQDLNALEFVIDSIPNQEIVVDLIWWR